MQNKSYERYVELLRAAELQTYERTASHFIATVGTAAVSTATAWSWFVQNPITAFIASISTIAMVTVAALTMMNAEEPVKSIVPQQAQVQPQQSQEHLEQFQNHQQAVSSSDIQSTEVETERTTRVSGFTEATKWEEVSASVEQNTVALQSSAEPTERVKNDAIESEIVFVDPVITVDPTPTKPSDLRSVMMVGIEPHGVRPTHRWTIGLGMNSLPGVDANYNPNARMTLMLEASNGFALGIAAGLRSTTDRTSVFAGFRDTVIMVDDREVVSKIGRYQVTESSIAYAEVGITAAYHVFGLTESNSVYPAISAFAGFEGKNIALEQSLSVNWRMTSQLSALGGVSVREYPFIANSQILVSPLLGIRFGF